MFFVKADRKEVNTYINKFLLRTNDKNSELVKFLNHFNSSIWKELDTLSTARIEEMVYLSIFEGTNDEKSKGYLATWASKWVINFNNIKKIQNLLFDKLSIDSGESKYVL